MSDVHPATPAGSPPLCPDCGMRHSPRPGPAPLTAPDVVAGLLADVAERDERLAIQHEAMTQLRADHSEAMASASEKLARALAANQQWAETLGDIQQAARDRDEARAAFGRLAGHFTSGKQSGWSARISGTVLRRLCVAAMCEPPDGSDVPDDADVIILAADRDRLEREFRVAERERDEARALIGRLREIAADDGLTRAGKSDALFEALEARDDA